MKNGPYELIRPPADYPGVLYRGRYAYEHTVVWWQNTGELPPAGFVVHHKNEQKRDNRFENLELKPRGDHSTEHNLERSAGLRIWVSCGECGADYALAPAVLRTRLKQNKNGLFCSRSCGMKAAWRLTHSALASK